MTLAEFKTALENTEEIEITVTGRRSGRKISHPVWFVVEDDTLCLLPVKGSDSEWYKNILAHPSMTLSAGRTRWEARPKPITDPARVRDVVEKFRAKYGADQIAQYYSKLDVAVEVPLAGARGKAKPAARRSKARSAA